MYKLEFRMGMPGTIEVVRPVLPESETFFGLGGQYLKDRFHKPCMTRSLPAKNVLLAIK
jgi:hypothetical protein